MSFCCFNTVNVVNELQIVNTGVPEFLVQVLA